MVRKLMTTALILTLGLSLAACGNQNTGTSANRCILEIYRNDKLYNRIEKGVTGETVTFDDLRLVAQQTYDFVFWADCAEAAKAASRTRPTIRRI